MDEALRALTQAGRAWPFEEARKLAARFEQAPPAKGYVLFETGYGPSGLPHLGTFGEVVRTTMVRRAFESISDVPTRLFCFSDDMDGLRKVPDNVPNADVIRPHLGKPLTQVPDPFGTHDSFGAHNNARLRAFLDSFGFEYEFQSATDWYKSGRFDSTLKRLFDAYDDVMALMLPTLGEERQATYSPFLPVSPSTGRVLQVPIERKSDYTIVFEDEDGTKQQVPITGGHVKVQWKPDWAMRWAALGVDYEMSGKDLISSVELASKIVKLIGGRAPEGFTYELFLDEKGQKISKSKGNGLTVEEWLRYAPPESLALFMFQKPKSAKKLYFDVIPRAVDDYLTHLEKFSTEEPAQRIENPSWHIHHGKPPQAESGISFNILLNLAGVVNAEHKDVLWGFISRYVAGATPANNPSLDRLAGYAVAYYQDFVRPTKQHRLPTDLERAALEELRAALRTMDPATDVDTIQTAVFEIGKHHAFASLRDWFKAQYEVLLGQSDGPRMGSFIKLYGVAETVSLIDGALARTV
ncbi:lysine--tRNA ligase [Roseiterribacter gracilis]|uniref:Lysine--tRNA ligase n=1 Tax=Roseiterribacter gracilis TaxID=2812848 RepID=A0A8S8X701_9PROT|nr:lysine--tRNA ligase [Rhodospirillales bacterium TMPK1]